MRFNPETFHTLARVFSLIFVVLMLFMIFVLVMLSNGPWTAKDFFELLLFGGSYVIGLLIGLKRPIKGGLISFITPMYLMILLANEASTYSLSSLTQFFILMIPGLLLILSWYVQQREDRNEKIGEDDLTARS